MTSPIRKAVQGKRKCFACDRALGKNPALVDTRDGQTVYVGSECFKVIKAAGEDGYQPPLGGPRLWVIPAGLSQQEIGELHVASRRTRLDGRSSFRRSSTCDARVDAEENSREGCNVRQERRLHMILPNQADAMVFAALHRGDYLPFAERNMREEFSNTAVRPRLRTWNNRERSMRDELPIERLGSIPKTTPSTHIVSICGWCDGAKERTKALTDTGKRVSHSICPACAKRMEAE